MGVGESGGGGKGGKIIQRFVGISGMAGKEKQQKTNLEASLIQMMRMDLGKVARRNISLRQNPQVVIALIKLSGHGGLRL